eukprot:4371818-Amphidinium_carterae.1
MQVTSDHCYHMNLLARISSSGLSQFMDNTSEPATVLSMNQTLLEFGFVNDFMSLCPTVDVCEPATTIDPSWTDMCDHRCSMHQPIDNTSSTLTQELDVYHFDASHLAWSLGRLGLH